jgi:hypothetical protein
MPARILYFLILVGLGSRIFAQVDRATLVGTVTDTTGAVVTGGPIGGCLPGDWPPAPSADG